MVPFPSHWHTSRFCLPFNDCYISVLFHPVPSHHVYVSFRSAPRARVHCSIHCDNENRKVWGSKSLSAQLPLRFVEIVCFSAGLLFPGRDSSSYLRSSAQTACKKPIERLVEGGKVTLQVHRQTSELHRDSLRFYWTISHCMTFISGRAATWTVQKLIERWLQVWNWAESTASLSTENLCSLSELAITRKVHVRTYCSLSQVFSYMKWN